MSEHDMRTGSHNVEANVSDAPRREPVPDRTMTAALFAKMAKVRAIGGQTGADVAAAEREVLRQLSQVAKGNEGNPITGEGITKSGDED